MSEPLKPTNISNDTHQDRPKEARPASAWKAFKETWQAEMKKAAATQSTRSGPMQPGANKPFHVIFTSVIMGLLIFGFIRFAVNTKQSAKEVNNRELDLRSAQTQRLDQALGLAQTQSQWLPSGQESRYLAIFGFNALGLNDYNQRHFSFPPE